jgi:hypothetical protein
MLGSGGNVGNLDGERYFGNNCVVLVSNNFVPDASGAYKSNAVGDGKGYFLFDMCHVRIVDVCEDCGHDKGTQLVHEMGVDDVPSDVYKSRVLVTQGLGKTYIVFNTDDQDEVDFLTASLEFENLYMPLEDVEEDPNLQTGLNDNEFLAILDKIETESVNEHPNFRAVHGKYMSDGSIEGQDHPAAKPSEFIDWLRRINAKEVIGFMYYDGDNSGTVKFTEGGVLGVKGGEVGEIFDVLQYVDEAITAKEEKLRQ